MFSKVRGNKTLLLRTSPGYVPDAREHVSRGSNNVVRKMGLLRLTASQVPKLVVDRCLTLRRIECQILQLPGKGWPGRLSQWTARPRTPTTDRGSTILKSRNGGELAIRGGMISELKAKAQLGEEAASKQELELQGKLRAANAERSDIEQDLCGSM